MKRKLLKAGAVAGLMGVTPRTLENWAADPADDFPKPVTRNGKFYWVESEVDDYIERMVEARDAEWAKIRKALQAANSA
ncbi:MAG TPA: transcriptional regulator [Blastocatellia bacterium]|nr:transcriptional regulator [Blastocatellia bacterium]